MFISSNNIYTPYVSTIHVYFTEIGSPLIMLDIDVTFLDILSYLMIYHGILE